MRAVHGSCCGCTRLKILISADNFSKELSDWVKSTFHALWVIRLTCSTRSWKVIGVRPKFGAPSSTVWYTILDRSCFFMQTVLKVLLPEGFGRPSFDSGSKSSRSADLVEAGARAQESF